MDNPHLTRSRGRGHAREQFALPCAGGTRPVYAAPIAVGRPRRPCGTHLGGVADEYPEKLAQLQARWEELAWEHNVYPLYDDMVQRISKQQDNLFGDRREFVYYSPDARRIAEKASAASWAPTSSTCVAAVSVLSSFRMLALGAARDFGQRDCRNLGLSLASGPDHVVC